jgi:hypothetical protein
VTTAAQARARVANRVRELYSERVGPSMIDTYDQCEAKVCYDRVDGLRDESSAQAYGTTCHAILQAYFELAEDVIARAVEILRAEAETDAVLDNADELERDGLRSRFWATVSAGLHLLPNPRDCLEIRPEQEVELAPVPLVSVGDNGELRPIEGTRDLMVRTTRREFDRLFPAMGAAWYAMAGGWLVVDFKTSTDPEKWGKHPDKLFEDQQGVIYPLAALREPALARYDAIPCRWVYFPSREPYRAAKASDFVQSRVHAEAAYVELSRKAQEIVSLIRLRTPGDRAKKNPQACNAYGGCKRHRNKGGTCDARQNFGAAAHALRAQRRPLSTTEETMAQTFAERQAAKNAAKGATAPQHASAGAINAATATPQADPADRGIFDTLIAMIEGGAPEAAVNVATSAMTGGRFASFDELAALFPEAGAEPAPATPAAEPPKATMPAVAETQGEPPATKVTKPPRRQSRAVVDHGETPAAARVGNTVSVTIPEGADTHAVIAHCRELAAQIGATVSFHFG